MNHQRISSRAGNWRRYQLARQDKHNANNMCGVFRYDGVTLCGQTKAKAEEGRRTAGKCRSACISLSWQLGMVGRWRSVEQ